MSAAGWALLVAAVLGMGMIVSTSTRLVVARIGRPQTAMVGAGAFVPSVRPGAHLPDAEAAVARLLHIDRRSVRMVRVDDAVVHCVVVVAPHALGDAMTQLSTGFDQAFLERHHLTGSRVMVTAEAA